ncbi:MAG: single-stranded-DNA-specific exonuclease RecJ [Clostridia bacterium]|nr:single-stranded-DNA-specific exonuclease RecJ [Clostridia bacterium]
MKIVQKNNFDEKRVYEYAKSLKVTDFAARLLLSRGFDIKSAEKYMYGTLNDLTDPFAYSGMRLAVDIVRKCIDSGKKIVFYGDYDCDGIGAVSILTRAFSAKDICCDYYVPVRSDEGYGLHCEAIKKIKTEKKADLIVTVDCGITSVREVEYCKQLGMEIIVTDHHRPGEILPDCIVVDPCLDETLTPLCGAGVALYLVRGLFGDDEGKNYLDICALSTVADIVPLVDDNRIIVKYGIELIRMGLGKVGIKALLQASEIPQKALSTVDIGFKIGPRLNSAGRLSTAENAIRILITDDPTEAMLIARELSMQNGDRQTIEKQIVESAMKKLQSYDFGKYKIIILYDESWDEGVNGIAAAKLTEYFNLPTILLTKGQDGRLKGSARSIAGVNIHEAISTQKEKLYSFGGHAMAAGISLFEKNLASFINGINSEISKKPIEIFERVFYYDLPFSMFDVTPNIVKTLRYFEPFGYGNPTPVFWDPAPSVKFSRLKGRHLKGKTKIGDVISFGNGYACDEFNTALGKSALYTIDKNFFNGSEYDQIKIKKLFFDRFKLKKVNQIERFCAFSVNISVADIPGKQTARSMTDPRLDVFFDKESFDEFCENNEEYVRIFGETEFFIQGKIAVLLPDANFPFSYYNSITIHGKTTDSVREYFSALGASFSDNSCDSFLPRFSIEEMRKTYVDIVQHFRIDYVKRYFTTNDIFEVLKKNGYLYDEERFVLYFFILLDLKLLKWENGAILLGKGEKVDLNASSLYRFVNGNIAY